MAGRSHAAATRAVGGEQENQTFGEAAKRLTESPGAIPNVGA